jgi:hypothetical protein
MDKDSQPSSNPREPRKREPRKPDPGPDKDRALETLERWVNSPGLQPPK